MQSRLEFHRSLFFCHLIRYNQSNLELACCRLALQVRTRLSLKFNGLAETEVPFLAFQSRLLQAFWALKMGFVDRSIDHAFSTAMSVSPKETHALPYPFNRDCGAQESHME